MYIVYIFIFGLLFLLAIICTIVFKNYKKSYIGSLTKKDVPFKLIAGFSALIVDIIHQLPIVKKRSSSSPTAKKLTSLNAGKSPALLLYNHRLRVTSYLLSIFIICMLLGFIYSCSLLVKENNTIKDLTRPTLGDGDESITLIADSELYSGTIDIILEEKEYTFDEAMSIFQSYREELDAYVLWNNESFLYVTSPLRFPSSLGDEQISISWDIENTHIIDYSGQLILDNVSSEGSETEIIATLTLGDITAEIIYHIAIYPPKLEPDQLLSAYVNTYINSEDKLYSSQVHLPENMDGIKLKFFENDRVLPPLVFHHHTTAYPYTDNFS